MNDYNTLVESVFKDHMTVLKEKQPTTSLFHSFHFFYTIYVLYSHIELEIWLQASNIKLALK